MNAGIAERMTEPAAADEPRVESLYAELKRIVEEHGLLKKQPLYYSIKVPLTYVFYALGWLALVFVGSLWFRILDAVFLAFMTVQLGFVGHDAGHRAIFRSSWKNDILGLLNGLSVGASFSWWMDTHNKHHAKPNQESLDPAIDYSVIAFSEEQARSKSGITRFMIRHQALFFIPLLMLYPISMRVDSLLYLIKERTRYRALELTFLIVHFPLYFFCLYSLIGFWHTVIFALIHQTLFGLYLSSVFVPNHMGMPIVVADEKMDFIVQQAVTARNIKGPRIVDFLFGGLNYQIEHHLFPAMPRNRLRRAKKLVEEFLRERSIEYHETSVFQSFREIFADLHRVGKSLKK